MNERAHALKSEELKGLQDNLKAASGKLPSEAEHTHSDEIARLRKAIGYIDNLLQEIDPDLTPLKSIKEIGGMFQECTRHVNDYLQNNHPSHLRSANEYIDSVIARIAPYALHSRAKAAANAFNEHIKAIVEETEILRNNAKSFMKEIRQAKTKYDNANQKIEAIAASAQEFEQKTLKSAGEKDNLEVVLENFQTQVEQRHNEIEDLCKKLTEGEDSTIAKINKAESDAFSAKDEIAETLESVKEETDDLSKFHEKIFGKAQEDGKREGGLEQDLEDLKAKLKKHQADAEASYSALEKRVTSLLPGAASAGLAAAYHELKKASRNGAMVYAVASYFFMALLLAPHLIEWYAPNLIPLSNSDFAKTWYGGIFNKILLLGPILWLAIFSSKRRSEYRRLQEEYAHKEALAKSYMGYKAEAEKLEEGGDKTLMRQLLESAINAISFNASTTLDKKHGDKTPIHEAAEGTANKFTDGKKK